MNGLLAALAVLALAMPLPPAGDGGILIPLCGGGTMRLPAGGGAPEPMREDCRKACHAACERQRRGARPG